MSFPIELKLPDDGPEHAVLSKIWARKKIEDLSDQLAVAAGDPQPLEEEITDLALRHRLMSAYTSFVAVDEEGGAVDGPRPPRRMLVPLPLPEGVSFEGVFGDGRDEAARVGAVYMGSSPLQAPTVPKEARSRRAAPVAPPPPPAQPMMAVADAFEAQRISGGVVGGVPGGVVGGVVGGLLGGITGGPPAASPTPERSGERLLRVRSDADLAAARRWSPIPAPDRQRRHVEARAALEQARRHLADGREQAARRQLQLAHVLEETYLRAQPWGDDGTRAGIAELWEAAAEAGRQAAVQALPALATRLDLVVRNADLAAALRSVAVAARVEVRIEPGSLEDAAALSQAERLRVPYRDLRGAQAEQAFTWLLQPAGLEWRVADGRVDVRSARRADGLTAWVYHAADLAAPSAGVEAAAEAAGQAVRDVEVLVGAALPRERNGTRAVMLDEDLLLVVAERGTHAAVAALLDRARSAGGSEAGNAAFAASERAAWEAVHERGVANREDRERRTRLVRIRRAAAVLDRTSWALLAAAYRRGPFDEAAAEMQEAWESLGRMAEVSSLTPSLVARCLWAIEEADAEGPPQAPGIEGLRTAASRAAGWAGTFLEQLGQSPDDAGLRSAAVYLALLARPGSTAAVTDILERRPDAMAAVARLLLGDGRNAEPVRRAIETGGLRGDDAVFLGALALHRTGAPEWNRARDGRVALARTGRVSASTLRVLSALDASPPGRESPSSGR